MSKDLLNNISWDNISPEELYYKTVFEVKSSTYTEAFAKVAEIVGAPSGDAVRGKLRRAGLMDKVREDFGLRDRAEFVKKYGKDIVQSVETEKQLKKVLAENKRLKDFWELMRAEIARYEAKRKPIKVEQVVPKIDSDEAYVANIVIGDVQGGTVFKTTDAQGVAPYNMDIMLERGKKLTEKIIQLTEIKRKAFPINTLCMDFLGDLIEGVSIYPGQRNYAINSVLEQVYVVTDMFVQMIVTLKKWFNRILIQMVPGNHGRFSKHHHKADNFDNLVAEMLRLKFMDVDGIDLVYAKTGGILYRLDEIPKWLHLITHGDNIRSYSRGIPYYGIDRANAQYGQFFGEQADLFKIGHHHRDATISDNNSYTYINGSWVGTSPFAAEKRLCSRPSQKLLTIHEHEGVIMEEKVWLDNPKEWKANERGVKTPVFRNRSDQTEE
jgi:hypothetical protein